MLARAFEDCQVMVLLNFPKVSLKRFELAMNSKRKRERMRSLFLRSSRLVRDEDSGS